ERAKKYRISPELARRIRARDGTCRHPGCSVPAEQCDVDHIVPFDHSAPEKGGLTLERNLMCLCRRHHRYKTFTKARYEYMNEGRIRILIDRHILTTEPTGPLARARSWRPMSTNRDGAGATGRPGRSGRSPPAQPPTSGPPPSGPPPPGRGPHRMTRPRRSDAQPRARAMIASASSVGRSSGIQWLTPGSSTKR